MRKFNNHTWPKNKDAAEELCVKEGGILASIKSPIEQTAVDTLLRNQQYSMYWIGASDERDEGTWLWSDGSPLTYNFWANDGYGWYDEPNGERGRTVPPPLLMVGMISVAILNYWMSFVKFRLRRHLHLSCLRVMQHPSFTWSFCHCLLHFLWRCLFWCKLKVEIANSIYIFVTGYLPCGTVVHIYLFVKHKEEKVLLRTFAYDALDVFVLYDQPNEKISSVENTGRTS